MSKFQLRNNDDKDNGAIRHLARAIAYGEGCCDQDALDTATNYFIRNGRDACYVEACRYEDM